MAITGSETESVISGSETSGVIDSDASAVGVGVSVSVIYTNIKNFTEKHYSMVDTVIKNARIVRESRLITVDIGITDGKISEISKNIDTQSAEVYDAKNNILFPGFIDAHAHIHDKNFLRREDFRSGSISAVCGGITTFIEMPTDYPVLTESEIMYKIKAGEDLSFANFGLNAGNLTPESIKRLPQLLSTGISAVKAFFCAPYSLSDNDIVNAMKYLHKLHGQIIFHCENDEIIRECTEKWRREGDEPVFHCYARPEIAEIDAIARAINFAGYIGTKTHIAHVSTKKGMELIAEAKIRGIPITAEVCSHHLVLTQEDIKSLGELGKINPPLRTHKDTQGLWQGLATGAIDIVVTDHFSSFLEEKNTVIWDAPAGVPGIETLVPIMISDGVNEGRITLTRLQQVLSENPAKIFGLYPRKGCIEVGSDADFTLIDLKKEDIITGDKLKYKVGWTPYEGKKVKGVPLATFVNGILVAEEGELVTKRPIGRFVAASYGSDVQGLLPR